ncbi:MAG: TIGR01906 family membrane protein [Nanoarchaeota archaeon]
MKPHNYAIVFIPLAIILSNFTFLLFNTGFYEKESEKNGVYSVLNRDEVNTETKGILAYFRGGEETFHTEFFNPRERIHLLQVREIIRKVLFMWISVLALFLISLFLHPNFYKVFLYGGLASIVILILMSLFFIGFSSNFVAFHEVFFKDNTWMLDPETDNLVKMFPEQFFIDFLKRLVFSSILTSAVVAAAPFLLKRFKKKKDKF